MVLAEQGREQPQRRGGHAGHWEPGHQRGKKGPFHLVVGKPKDNYPAGSCFLPQEQGHCGAEAVGAIQAMPFSTCDKRIFTSKTCPCSRRKLLMQSHPVTNLEEGQKRINYLIVKCSLLISKKSSAFPPNTKPTQLFLY